MTATKFVPSRYPIPTPERRAIVQRLSALTAELDAEAASRIRGGGWNNAVRHELRRAAGSLRLVATLIVNGSMSTERARFWTAAAQDYLQLVRRADRSGIIR
jgi:hypothetical protein